MKVANEFIAAIVRLFATLAFNYASGLGCVQRAFNTSTVLRVTA